MSNTKIAAAARRATLAGLLGAAATATVIGFAGAANAAPGTPSPNANHELGMYGNPAAAARYWQKQHDSDCAEMAVADVVGEITGHEPTEQQIDAVAENTPSAGLPGPIWHHGGVGTAMYDVPRLLAHYGIQSAVVNTSSSALEQDLAEGHKVLAFVNGGWLHNSPPDGHDPPTHMVVVIGIDTKNGVVHLNDSGAANGRDEQISIATFERAWSRSNNQAVVTK
jgi:hypothetical protein